MPLSVLLLFLMPVKSICRQVVAGVALDEAAARLSSVLAVGAVAPPTEGVRRGEEVEEGEGGELLHLEEITVYNPAK